MPKNWAKLSHKIWEWFAHKISENIEMRAFVRRTPGEKMMMHLDVLLHSAWVATKLAFFLFLDRSILVSDSVVMICIIFAFLPPLLSGISLGFLPPPA